MPPLNRIHRQHIPNDFQDNELLNAVLQHLISNPVVHKEGKIFYNSFKKIPFYSNGTEWIPFFGKPVQFRYASEALMLAAQPVHNNGYIYYRSDQDIYYEYLGTVLGTMADYNAVGGSGTTYIHPLYTPITQTLSSATVLASFTSDSIGSVTGFTTRTLTQSDLGIDLSLYVPYIGATGNVNLGNNSITLDTVLFNNLAPNGILPRQLRWNNEDSTLDLGMGLGAVVQQMGQEVYHSPVKNQTGSTIPDGSLVAYSGTVGASGRINIQLAIADGTIESRKILGLATHEILNGEDGLVTWFGKVRGLNTTGTPVGETWALGNTLWAHPTLAGKLTNVKPTAPNLKVSVGIVVSVHATTGTILITTTLGSNINDDEGVNIVSVADKNILQYQVGTGVWENKSLSGAGIVGGSGTLNYIPKWTPDGVRLGNSQVFDDGTGIGIGTTVIGVRLAVNGAVRFNYDGVNNAGVSYFDRYLDHSRFIMYNSGGGTGVVLQTGGNSWITGGLLGVQTDAPTETIDVNGSARFRSIANLGTAATNVMVPSATGVQSLRTVAEFRGDIGAFPSSSVSIAAGQVAFGTGINAIGGDNNIFWDNVNKRLGVGTITPGSLVDLSGISGTTLSISIPFSAAAYCDILFTSPAVSTYNARIRSTIPGDGTRNLQFITATGAVEGIAATILGNGNVGIGTILPSSPLHVVGTTNDGSNLITFVQSGTGRALQIVRGTGGATRSMVNFVQNNAAGGAEAVLDIQQATIVSNAIKVTNDGDIAVFTVTGGGNMHAVGTVRIGNIANLGSAAINVMVPSATGVQSLRTVTELAGDMSAVQYISQSLTSAQKLQARVNIGSTSSTPQIIATAGAINDLAVTSNHLVFTGASVSLSGIVAGLDGEEITLLNISGTNLTILSEDVLSVVANRFNSGVIIPNLSILRIKYRTTTNRWFLENVGINDGRYVRKDVADTKTGNLTLMNNLSGSVGRLDWVTSSVSGNLDGSIRFGENNIEAFRIGRDNVTGNGYSTPQFERPVLFYGSCDWRSGGLFGTNTAKLTVSTGRLFHARSGAENESIIRNEKYLNTSENVVTAGAINDQAITAGIFNQRFTLATSITGHANGENGRELIINNANSVSCDLVYESVSSTAANRYYFATLANLTIPSRGIVTLIYNSTISRWELKSKNF